MSNLRQLSVGTQLYLNDNNNHFWPSDFPPSQGWFADDSATGVAHGPLYYLNYNCFTQLFQRGTVMDCPANPDGWAGATLDYCYNSCLDNYTLLQIHRPSQVVLFMDGHSYEVNWPSQNPTDTFQPYWTSKTLMIGAFVHQGKANCVFLDGHIEQVTPAQMANDIVPNYCLDPLQ